MARTRPPGETDDYTLGDHLDAIRTHIGFDLFDYFHVAIRVLLERGRR